MTAPAAAAGDPDPPRAGFRNVVVMSVAMFALVAGEQLGTRFLPRYLVFLGAPAVAVGLWGSGKDFLDAALQYPGGALSDRFGSQRALMLFTAIAGLGYVVYALAPDWPWLFLGLALAAAWGSLASPGMFALVAESLPSGRRALGFTVQSILRRVPILFAPALGGLLVERRGLPGGLRAAFGIAAGLALLTLLFQRRFYVRAAGGVPPVFLPLVELWRRAPSALRRLLVADVLARAAESAADVFVVLVVLDRFAVPPSRYGAWVGLQMAVSIASYFPGAWLATRFGRVLPVTITFVMFAAFPLAVALARDAGGLPLAFVLAGLRELGEPARKALIVDASPPGARGQTVGAYYLARSLLILPAGVLGGLAWARDPRAPFLIAAAFGAVGVVWFLATFRDPVPDAATG